MGIIEDKVFEVKHAKLKQFFLILAEYLVTGAFFYTFVYLKAGRVTFVEWGLPLFIVFGAIIDTRWVKDSCVTVCREVVLITVGNDEYAFPLKDYLRYCTKWFNHQQVIRKLVFQTPEGENFIILPWASRKMIKQIDEAINEAKQRCGQ